MAARTQPRAHKGSKKGGSLPRIFTDEEKAIVKLLSISGFTHSAIASAVKTDKDTLYKHFRPVLDEAKIKFDAMVMGKIAKAIEAGDYKMTSLYVQNNWRHWTTTRQIELSGKDGAPLTAIIEVVPHVKPDKDS